ncbi:MAG: hypothetical protein IT201_03215 [Thermoleophilia bacterium]|nr:hypothetical protein [Thermoleophilia bacterium]
MTRKRRITLGTGLIALGGLAAGGAALAGAGGGSETSAAADRARAAALAHLGGGEAGSVERDSEDGAVWEVEVRKADGGTVDVRLAADFSVVTVEADSDAGGETGDDG